MRLQTSERIDTFAMNPQYRIKVTDSDPNDEVSVKAGRVRNYILIIKSLVDILKDQLCTVIIAVMQKYRRELKHTGIYSLGSF